MPETSKTSQPRRGSGPARHLPPLWVWIPVACLVAGIVYIRVRNVTGDHSVVNILTAVLAFLAVQVIVFWFVFLSGYSRLVRYGSALAGMAAVVAFFFLFEIHHVSGEMVPAFRLRFAPPRDQLLEVPDLVDTTSSVDVASTTEHDFNQFLGPRRRARTNTVRLAANWDQQPPRPVWRQPIGAGWSAFAAVNGYAVTLEQRGSEELVTCYEVATGELKWSYGVTTRHETTLGGVGPRSTPTIHQGKVYALGATGHLACLDGATGDPIWTDNLLERYNVSPQEDLSAVAWGRSGSPLIVESLLIVPAGGPPAGPHKSLIAYDKDNGQPVWEGGDRQVSYASPIFAVLDGVEQVVSVNEDNVSGHDLQTGDVLWQSAWPGHSSRSANTSQPVVYGDRFLVVSKGYAGGAALLELSQNSDQWSVNEVWRNRRVLKTKFANLVVHDSFAYGLSDGILECVEISTGKSQWKRGRYGHGQILGVHDLILVQSESGDLALVQATPERLEELGSIDHALEGKSWNNLCLHGPFLLMRNSEQAACFELPLASSPADAASPEAAN